MITALENLCSDPVAAAAALGLGPTQSREIQRNRDLRTAAVMPALDRYTGVLYDGLDAATLGNSAREFAYTHVAIQSALFGVTLAADLIPAYRLSHNSRLPGVSITKTWKRAVANLLFDRDDLVVDLRSDSYAALGPSPSPAAVVHVVSESADGVRTALSHFNKKAKGEFTRAVVDAGIDHDDVDSLCDWAIGCGFQLRPRREGGLDLVV